MSVDFGALIIDLESLVSSSTEDFSSEFWGSYEDYVNKYNQLLKDIQSLGFYKNLKFLEQVPFSDQSFDSGYSKQEKAKLREVANESQVLLSKVKLLLSPKSEPKFSSQVRSNKIFLVHGQDNEMKNDVTQTLQKLELEPIILHEQPDSPQTLIKKIDDYAHVSFAVVLVSPDEQAIPKQTPDEPKYRAGQNVIFELGYLLGRLGKQNVAAIYRKQKDFELPNHHNEVLWIEYNSGWYFKLIQELQAANFDVDANKLGWL